MISEEYRVVSIIIFESFVDILVLSSFIFYHFNYANIFHYYAKAILPNNLNNLL